MDKITGHWNPIEPDVVCQEYDGVTLQVWLALLIINPNKCGVFSLFPYDLPGIVSKIRKRKTKKADVEEALNDIESRGWIRRYPGNIVWIKDRWNYVGNRNNANTVKNAETLVAQYPAVWEHFKQHYNLQCSDSVNDTVNNTVNNSVTNSVGNKEKEKGKEEEKEDKSSDKPELAPFKDFVKELFHDVNGRALVAQAKELEMIQRIDGCQLEDIKPVLLWAIEDDFWSKNFQSCAGLRKKRHGAGDRMKWEKIKASYQKKGPDYL